MSIARIQHLEQEIARLHALQAEALLEVASAERVVDDYLLIDPNSDVERRIRIEDAVREEVAAALRWSPTAAQARIDEARLLAGPLSAAMDALRAGEVTPGHVRVIVEHANRLPGATDRLRRGADGRPDARAEAAEAEFAAACESLQRRVLPTARRSTIARTRQAARRAVLAIDTGGERRRREQARCTRDVYVIDALDGISTLVARLATEDAHALMSLVDAAAHESPDSELPLGERRAEALAGLTLGGCGQGPRVLANIDLVIDLPTLLALQDDAVELRGAGALPADVVRDLMADPRVAVTLHRLVSDPLTGHLLDHGRRTYEIPVALREFIAARDGVCRFPGCQRRASRCQVDHAVAWDDGGTTGPSNLGALCVRHHQLKTHGGWEIVDSRPDGSCTWRSPAGRTYEHQPRSVPSSRHAIAPEASSQENRPPPDPPPF